MEFNFNHGREKHTLATCRSCVCLFVCFFNVKTEKHTHIVTNTRFLALASVFVHVSSCSVQSRLLMIIDTVHDVVCMGSYPIA